MQQHIADHAIIATLAVEALKRPPTEADRVTLAGAIRREKWREYRRRYALARKAAA